MSDSEPEPLTNVGERETHIFNPEDHQHLRDPERLDRIQFDAFLDRLEVEPGQTVVDLGTGSGVMLPLIQERLQGEGRVFGLDVSAGMVALARQTLVEQDLEGVSVLENSDQSIPLRDRLADRLFMVFVLHEVSHPTSILSEVYRVVAPGGRVGVLDWNVRTGNPEEGPPVEHRVGPEQAEEWFHQAGFETLAREEWTEDLYLLILGKP